MATAAIIILLLSLAAPSLISCSWPSDFLCGVWLLNFLWAHAHPRRWHRLHRFPTGTSRAPQHPWCFWSLSRSDRLWSALCDRSSLPTIAASPPNGPPLVIVSTSVPPTIATPPSEHTTAVASLWVLCSLAQPSAFRTPQTKLWDKIATVISIGQHRTYRVRLASGRVLWRNRRFHRVIPSAPTSSPAENQPSSDTSDQAPRRSTRTRNAPTRLTMWHSQFCFCFPCFLYQVSGRPQSFGLKGEGEMIDIC